MGVPAHAQAKLPLPPSLLHEPESPYVTAYDLAGLAPGRRRSADRTRLPANSLLTWNFTGKLAILGDNGKTYARSRCYAGTSWAIPYTN